MNFSAPTFGRRGNNNGQKPGDTDLHLKIALQCTEGYGSKLFSSNSGESKNVLIPISNPWHSSWMIRSLTES